MPSIVGAQRLLSAAPTTAHGTAPRLYKQGYAFGTVINPTSLDKTITWYGVYASTANTARPLRDQDNVAATQTLTAGAMSEIHEAVAGVPIAVPVCTTGASTVDLPFAFYR